MFDGPTGPPPSASRSHANGDLVLVDEATNTLIATLSLADGVSARVPAFADERQNVTTRAANDPLSVAVIGDSMFAVGETMVRSVIAHTDDIELTHWEAISGTAISDHPSALSVAADVVVTSFAFNDTAAHGWPGARPWLVRFLEAHADSQVVWVRSDPGTSQDMINFYEWLDRRADQNTNLHLVDFGDLHGGQPTWTCGDPCGGLGFHLEPGHGGVAVMASMIRSQLEELARNRQPG